MDRILLFGGSFNPLHNGHLIVGRAVAEHLRVKRVILIPSASPPHKQNQALAPAEARLALCHAVADEDPLFHVDDWELKQAGPNYTLLTIQRFRELHGPDVELFWLIGLDSLHELGTWYKAAELVDACTIVSAARPGFDSPDPEMLARWFSPSQIEKLLQHVVEGPRIDIAATDIRARVRRGQSIRYLVPDVVRHTIESQGIYRGD